MTERKQEEMPGAFGMRFTPQDKVSDAVKMLEILIDDMSSLGNSFEAVGNTKMRQKLFDRRVHLIDIKGWIIDAFHEMEARNDNS